MRDEALSGYGELMNLLVARLGAERASIVIERAGGRRLAIPTDLANPRATDSLKRLVGSTVATALVLHFAGQTIYVPRAAQDGTAKLSTVVRMTKAGKSAGFIARRLQCSDRTVYARRAEARELGLLEE